MDKMNLAHIYYIGDGYTFDRVKALEIYKELAQDGNVEAMYYCGLCLEYLGKRNHNNYIEAYKYFTESANLGYEKSIKVLKEFKNKYNIK